jgi:hypothetical protein
MKWLDKWLLSRLKKASEWEREDSHKKERAMAIGQTAMIDRGNPEGEDRISFELTSAVGGRILNVRRYDTRTDRHNNTTYVIPSGEDVGTRVAKILNLELIK